MHIEIEHSLNYHNHRRRLRQILIFFCFLLLMPSAAYAASEPFVSYSIACPFFTLLDEITPFQLRALAAKGIPLKPFMHELVMLQASFDQLVPPMGGANLAAVKIVAATELDEMLHDKMSGVCAIVPTVTLRPEWKRIGLSGVPAPWDQDYVLSSDPLAFSVTADDTVNRYEPEKTTRLLLTGTTALARTTAYKMAEKGINYPGEAIKPVFENADLRHISNESSIWSACPIPAYNNTTMQFCTPGEFWKLFRYLGVNVIELTGNHLRDYDWAPLAEMLDLFRREGFPFYAAGRTKEEAAQPLFVTDHGNPFVFLGCNIAGPNHVFVDDSLPGVHRCDFDQLEKEIREFRAQGFLVIVTIQYYEIYSRPPSDTQRADFQRISDAGATVLTGSQAHYAQTMKPQPDRFIHYGLGNLFFDQMDRPIPGTRQEFLDRAIFYDGKLLQVELITALLEDYAQPRPMTTNERLAFLTEIFHYAD